MIYGPDNIPVAPTGIVSRLKAIHPNLDLRFMPGHAGAYWGLAWDWPENDPRRWMIREGKLDPKNAWDMLAMLPPDCSVDEAYGYVVKSFRVATNETVKSLVNQLASWNTQATEDNWAPVMDEAMNRAEVSAHSLLGGDHKTPKVYQRQKSPKAPAKKTTRTKKA